MPYYRATQHEVTLNSKASAISFLRSLTLAKAERTLERFVVSAFDAAWRRARTLGAAVHESPNTDNGTGMRAFMLRDPDGYYVAINEARGSAD